MNKPDAAIIFSRVVRNEGHIFSTKTGKEFRYLARPGYIHVDRNRNIPMKDFETALLRMPVRNTIDLRDLQGPSYLLAILADDRICQGSYEARR
jgi:hypothetical protein